MPMSKITAQQSNAFVEQFHLKPYREGLLTGLNFAVKDSMDIIGKKTGCGSPAWLAKAFPSAANAPLVDHLLAQGASCIGKAATDELTFSLDGENAHYGTPLNPEAQDRVPGGSSSGSASAVACGLADFALGTDCGGSIRVPASNCGIYGLRPSFGTVSMAGVFPLAPSFDTAGILSAKGEVLEKTASVLLSLEPPFDASMGNVYLVKEAFALADKEVREALEPALMALLEAFPEKVKEISLHMLVEEYSPVPLQHWYETFSILQGAEIWASHGSWIENENPNLSSRVKNNFTYVKQIEKKLIGPAIERREWYFDLMHDFLQENDLLCFPTTPKLAPLKGSLDSERLEEEYYSKTLSVTSIAGICRLPEITLPLGRAESVPIGLSLAGAHRQDAFLLWAVKKYMEHKTWN